MKRSICIFVIAECALLLNCKALDMLFNQPPIIVNLTANPQEIAVNDTTTLHVEATDPENDFLSYRWECKLGGTFIENYLETVTWIAPATAGRFPIIITVSDENGSKTKDTVFVNVRDETKPFVMITQPVENQTILGLGFYTIKVKVTYLWPIRSVDFFINDKLSYTDYSSPYQWNNWNVTGLSGRKTIMVKAYDAKDPTNWGADSVHVTIEGASSLPNQGL
ncbi:MAG: Ig-like domain-containing protein [candidate division KSB1 bacterium]|nr:Ig-like domain-containing protein [candidate division KSB1 bacterium]MDZ7334863.1 Ig-like domain-containing protein [candidate division KSB1 bacterium]MDZ7375287.1 Ig-like domain-containing protein [candidate division KSB1 bacterium]MDZ7400408.1 Ig-like domain-containing protein [candidate division KSB1 bacterium]